MTTILKALGNLLSNVGTNAGILVVSAVISDISNKCFRAVVGLFTDRIFAWLTPARI